MAETEIPAFDCDNHYYEALDAFTRHVPKKMHTRCVQWAEIDGRKHHLVGGKLASAVKNPTWDPILKPGIMHTFFRGNPEGRNPMELMREREPLPDYYMDPAARLKKMDEQGLEATWLFPTLGVLYEELLKHDTEAVLTLFGAFNRWLDEDWGFNIQGRIYGAPYITLADVDWACRELEWVLGFQHLDHRTQEKPLLPPKNASLAREFPVSISVAQAKISTKSIYPWMLCARAGPWEILE